MLVIHQDAEVARWVSSRMDGPADFANAAVGIGWSTQGTLSAGLVFHSYVPQRNMFADIALAQSHFPIPLLRVGLLYPFQQLSLPRLTFSIDSTNHRSQKLVQRLGATREATLSCAAANGDLDFWVLRPDSDFCRKFLYGQERRSAGSRLRNADSTTACGEPAGL